MPGPAHGLTWEEYNKKFGDEITALRARVKILERENQALAIERSYCPG